VKILNPSKKERLHKDCDKKSLKMSKG